MKTLFLILSLFLVTTDQRAVFEHGVSSVTDNSIALHIGQLWFIDDDQGNGAVAASGSSQTFPAPLPALFITPDPLRSEPRQALLTDHPIRAPPTVLA